MSVKFVVKKNKGYSSRIIEDSKMVKGIMMGKKKSKKYCMRWVKKVMAINKQEITKRVTNVMVSMAWNSVVKLGMCEYKR